MNTEMSDKGKKTVKVTLIGVMIVVVALAYTPLADSVGGPLLAIRGLIDFALSLGGGASSLRGTWHDLESDSTINLGGGGYFEAKSPLRGTWQGSYSILEQNAARRIYRLKLNDDVNGAQYFLIQISSDGKSSVWQQDVLGYPVTTTWTR